MVLGAKKVSFSYMSKSPPPIAIGSGDFAVLYVAKMCNRCFYGATGVLLISTVSLPPRVMSLCIM